jgi:hypothetical protein
MVASRSSRPVRRNALQRTEPAAQSLCLHCSIDKILRSQTRSRERGSSGKQKGRGGSGSGTGQSNPHGFAYGMNKHWYLSAYERVCVYVCLVSIYDPRIICTVADMPQRRDRKQGDT